MAAEKLIIRVALSLARRRTLCARRLAERAGISRQLAGEAIVYLLEQGAIEQLPWGRQGAPPKGWGRGRGPRWYGIAGAGKAPEEAS